MRQFFKIKPGTKYDQAIKKHFAQKPRWSNVMKKVGELLGENITSMGLCRDQLWLDSAQLNNQENKKLLNKVGELKVNTKRAKEVLEQYKKFILEEELDDFEELRVINFIYGVNRVAGQELSYYITQDFDIYYETDFDLAQKTSGLVVPITEIEYQEKYLEELKKSS
ncbi:hypothetical protein NBRC13296_12780 [Paenibacillus chitinolyticus]|uniref:hypothetical protein n=1 Tax=Paenibacillus chitinolyticus TaxID=79263 RepID=UPI00355906D0